MIQKYERRQPPHLERLPFDEEESTPLDPFMLVIVLGCFLGLLGAIFL